MKLIDVDNFLKQYSDQVCGDTIDAIDLRLALLKEPTVEAIPVEWIGTWWDKQPLERDSVFFLLRDWERETGIDTEQHAQAIEEMKSRRAGEKENE